MTYPGPAWLVRVSGDVDFGRALAWPGHGSEVMRVAVLGSWGTGTGGGGPPWLGEKEGLSPQADSIKNDEVSVS